MAYTRPEPLEKRHAVGSFECGEPSLDNWLVRHARQTDASGSARVFVTTAGGDAVVGFYALAAGVVQPEAGTARLMKGQPTQRPVPVVVLARLGVDRSHQGRGVGRSLLHDALLRCAGAAGSIGLRAVVVHAVSTEAREWYLRYGFEESPTDTHHLILPMKDLRRFLDEVS